MMMTNNRLDAVVVNVVVVAAAVDCDGDGYFVVDTVPFHRSGILIGLWSVRWHFELICKKNGIFIIRDFFSVIQNKS